MSLPLRPALAMCALLVPLSALALVAGFTAPGCGNGSYIPVPVYEASSQDVALPSFDAVSDGPSDARSEATDGPTDASSDATTDAPTDAATDSPLDAPEDAPDGE